MAKLTAHPYDIARPTGVCAASGRPIEPGDTFVAALYEREGDDSFERRDYHAAMWEEASAPAAAEGLQGVLFGHWRGVMPAPNAKPKLFVDDEALLQLFEHTADATDEKRLAFRFVLALALVRKRLLRLDGARQEAGKEILLVRPKGADDDSPAMEVVDPGVDESAIASVAEQLGAVLEAGAFGEDA